MDIDLSDHTTTMLYLSQIFMYLYEVVADRLLLHVRCYDNSAYMHGLRVYILFQVILGL